MGQPRALEQIWLSLSEALTISILEGYAYLPIIEASIYVQNNMHKSVQLRDSCVLRHQLKIGPKSTKELQVCRLCMFGESYKDKLLLPISDILILIRNP